uniref:Uncharacterized protein n=1 Tax=Babesia bovis TaxID=5865 RepID=S6BFF7_BABBO|nr:hypothetical protein [Babesia bovis]
MSETYSFRSFNIFVAFSWGILSRKVMAYLTSNCNQQLELGMFNIRRIIVTEIEYIIMFREWQLVI